MSREKGLLYLWEYIWGAQRLEERTRRMSAAHLIRAVDSRIGFFALKALRKKNLSTFTSALGERKTEGRNMTGKKEKNSLSQADLPPESTSPEKKSTCSFKRSVEKDLRLAWQGPRQRESRWKKEMAGAVIENVRGRASYIIIQFDSK